MGSKNHEIVPTPLIEKLSHRRGGASAVHKSISNLAKFGLIARIKEAKNDVYRLTFGGLDYLALHTHSARNDAYSVGSRIGVGKESDIMVVADDKGTQRVLKIHRLGRISFRTVKSNRDNQRKRQSGSWMYLSRLSAMREFAFMRALRDAGFPVPDPISQSRHTIVMSLVDASPLRQIASVPDPASLYADLVALILRLAAHGLIHADFNEFNILIKEEKADPAAPEPAARDAEPTGPEEDPTDQTALKLTPILIDFPQMVSMDHPNAEMYFDRDVACVKRFFEKRFHFVPDEPGPFYKQARKTVGRGGAVRIDAAVEASGFTKKMAKDLEAAIREQQKESGDNGNDDDAFSSEGDGDEDGDEGEEDAGEGLDEETGDGREEELCPEPSQSIGPEDALLSKELDTKGMAALVIGGEAQIATPK